MLIQNRNGTGTIFHNKLLKCATSPTTGRIAENPCHTVYDSMGPRPYGNGLRHEGHPDMLPLSTFKSDRAMLIRHTGKLPIRLLANYGGVPWWCIHGHNCATRETTYPMLCGRFVILVMQKSTIEGKFVSERLLPSLKLAYLHRAK